MQGLQGDVALFGVEETVKQYGYCAIGASEGLQDKDGKFLSESGLKDAFGHSQLGGVAPMLANLVQCCEIRLGEDGQGGGGFGFAE